MFSYIPLSTLVLNGHVQGYSVTVLDPDTTDALGGAVSTEEH